MFSARKQNIRDQFLNKLGYHHLFSRFSSRTELAKYTDANE